MQWGNLDRTLGRLSALAEKTGQADLSWRMSPDLARGTRVTSVREENENAGILCKLRNVG